MGYEGATAHTAPPSLLTTCGHCGDVVIDVRRAWAVKTGGRGRYGFACPACRRPVEVTAADHLVDLLVCLGARPETGPAAALPLTADDLLDLRLALAADDDLARHAAPQP